jgi:wobble nucleotide-excising tRNase
MIESVTLAKVASYGPQPQTLSPLAKINYIFGANASGKTTIGRVIADPAKHPNCAVSWKDNRALETLVYNRDFVERNLTELKGVFTLGEKQAKTLDEIKEKKTEADGFKAKIADGNKVLAGDDGKGGKRGELASLEDNFQEQCWTAYGQHKAKLSAAFAGVRNSKKDFKAQFLKEVATNKAAATTLDDLHKRAEAVFGQVLTEAAVIEEIDYSSLLGYEGNAILKKRVIGKEDVDIAAMIKKLGNSDWVREGRAFYDVNDRVCPFCQQKTDEAFEKSLSEYFNEAFDNDSKTIATLLNDYKTESARVLQALERIASAKPKFIDLDKLQSEIDLLRAKVDLNIQQLVKKSKEPSQIFDLESVANITSSITAFIAKANKEIADFNTLVKNIDKERAKLTAEVWKHLIDVDLKGPYEQYKNQKETLDNTIKSIEQRVENFTTELRSREKSIRDLEKQTTSIQPTIDAINALLSSFGFHSFSIAMADSGNAYKLVREDKSDAKETLSEGERTFVTFLYFYHLIKGSNTETGITVDRIVVFDDPVSSLDSDILFIVGSLIKNVFDDVRKGGLIKQVFVLTHNVYFHKEVSFNKDRPLKGKRKEETFWVVRRPAGESVLETFDHNPIQTSYEMLWSEVKKENPSALTIQNVLRRILENYFKFFGGIDPRVICAKLQGKEQTICNSLLSWVNDGSHHAHDDLYVTMDDATVKSYLEVFKKIFVLSEHEAHYKMMMGEHATKVAAVAEPAAVA